MVNRNGHREYLSTLSESWRSTGAHPDTAPRSGAGDGHVASGCASYHAYSRMSCPATWPSPTPNLSYRSFHLGAVSKCTPSSSGEPLSTSPGQQHLKSQEYHSEAVPSRRPGRGLPC